MFILNPDQYLIPDFKISPFRTSDLTMNAQLPEDDRIVAYFKSRFQDRQLQFTTNGRSALNKALLHYHLQPTDEVLILTTSGNTYVSSCVTSEIEKFCIWTRDRSVRTKVVVVLHEFGYPFTEWDKVLAWNLPVIEDCAYAFFSDDDQHYIGNTGDFCIYSFPKMFPIQVGGLITSRLDADIPKEEWPQDGMERYIRNVMSNYIQQQEQIITQRLINYNWLNSALSSLGFEARFHLQHGTVPGVYMFKVVEPLDLPAMKTYLFKHGIQCSVFYGEQAFFIPNHQNLEEFDLSYLYFLLKKYLNG